MKHFIAILCLLASPFVMAQPADQEDYDVLIVPLQPSSHVPGKSFLAASPEEMGLNLVPVVDESVGYPFPMGTVLSDSATDEINIHLDPGEAVRFWSDAIPINNPPVSMSCRVTITGTTPAQAGMAILDSNDTRNMGVSLAYRRDIPRVDRNFSYEYTGEASSVYLLIQFVADPKSASEITVRNLRVTSGSHEIDYALGSTALTPVYHFGDATTIVSRFEPPSTAGGSHTMTTDHNRTKFPLSMSRALQLNTNSEDDVIQTGITTLLNEKVQQTSSPTRYYAEAYAKRLTGQDGIVSLAILGLETESVGYVDFPLERFPSDEWTKIVCPVQLEKVNSEGIRIITQLRGGPASIVLDDVALKTRIDSPHFWDADVIESLQKDNNN